MMISAPTMARRICAWITCDERGTSERRTGRTRPSAAPSTPAVASTIRWRPLLTRKSGSTEGTAGIAPPRHTLEERTTRATDDAGESGANGRVRPQGCAVPSQHAGGGSRRLRARRHERRAWTGYMRGSVFAAAGGTETPMDRTFSLAVAGAVITVVLL